MKSKKITRSRRNFLKNGVASIAGISFLPTFTKAKSQPVDKTNTGKKKIIYRILGRTGIKVPLISFGCGSTNNANLVKAGLNAGMVYLDTANSYGGGANELMTGKVVKDRPRKSFIVATKFAIPQDMRTGLLPENKKPSEFRIDMRRLMDQSLKRLQLNHVDILYLHGIGKPELVGEKIIKDVFMEFKKEGKTKFLGVSVHRNEPAVIRATVDEKIYDVILTSYNFLQPHKNEVQKAIEHAANTGLGIVGMKMMAGVYWDRERKHPINATAAMKWVLQDKNVHTIIPGITTFDQLEADMAIMNNLSLSEQEKSDLKLGEKTTLTGLYCAQCGHCQTQCPYKLDIPTLMRSYMYAYGYRDPVKAKDTLELIDLSNFSCYHCTTCNVQCTLGFAVKEKIMDIVRIKNIPREFLV